MFRLFFLLWVSAAAAQTPHPRQEARHRALVMTKPGVKAEALAAALPKDWQILASEGELYFLERETSVDSAALKVIRGLSGVIAVERDAVVFPNDRNQVSKTRGGPHTNADPVKPRASTTTKKPEPLGGCTLTELCSNGKAKYWAQDAVDAEAMKAKLRSWENKETARVAVVDSGFDAAQGKHFNTVDKVSSLPGALDKDKHPINNWLISRSSSPLIGDLTKDESGHGTMVSSMIAGKGKLGVAENVSLSVYRVTKPGDTGSTSHSVLQMAIYRACQDKKDENAIAIVNVSWGGRLDESGIETDETEEVSKKLIEKFAEMGCLIVKASGNDNFRRERKDDFEDPYLRVAATDPSRELADFSTVGEISAPGANVYVLESTTATKKAKPEKRCPGGDGGEGSSSPKRFVSGTSFAAPLAAGLASQVVRVLKSAPPFAGLAPKDRIRLVNRILKASTMGGMVNGLRAVVIARHWNESEEGTRAKALDGDGIGSLTALIGQPPDEVCEKPVQICEKQKTCETTIACFNEGREKVALCPASLPLTRDLAKTAFKQKSFELGYFYSRMFQDGGAEEKDLISMRSETLKSYLAAKGYQTSYAGPVNKEEREKALESLDPNFVRLVIAPYLEQKAAAHNGSPELTESLVRGMLASSEVRSSLELGVDPITGEDRGSNSTVEGVQRVLVSGRKIMGDARFTRLIQNYATEFNERIVDDVKFSEKYDLSFRSTKESTAAARVLDGLLRVEPPASRLHKVLTEAETSVLAQMEKVNQRNGGKTQAIPTMFGELFPTRSVFRGMMERNLDRIANAVTKHDLSGLAPMQAHYLVENVEKVADQDHQIDALLDVLESIARGKGWGEASDQEMTDTALAVLLPKLKGAPPEVLEKARARFNALALNAQNPEFGSWILKSYWGNDAFGVNSRDVLFNVINDKKERAEGLIYREHPLLDKAGIRAISRQLALYGMRMKVSDFPKTKARFELQYGLGLAWRGLVETPEEPGTKRDVPVFSEKIPDRFHPPKPPVSVDVGGGPTAEEYLKSLFAFGQSTESAKQAGEIIERGFRFYSYSEGDREENKNLVKEMSPTGGWRKAAEKYTSGAPTGNYDATQSVRDFIYRVDKAHQPPPQIKPKP